MTILKTNPKIKRHHLSEEQKESNHCPCSSKPSLSLLNHLPQQHSPLQPRCQTPLLCTQQWLLLPQAGKLAPIAALGMPLPHHCNYEQPLQSLLCCLPLRLHHRNWSCICSVVELTILAWAVVWSSEAEESLIWSLPSVLVHHVSGPWRGSKVAAAGTGFFGAKYTILDSKELERLPFLQ